MIEGKLTKGGKTFRLKYLFLNKLEGFRQFINEDIEDLEAKGYMTCEKEYADTTALYIRKGGKR